MLTRKQISAISLLCLLTSGPSFAQFVGDTFFRAPSISIAQGGTATMDLAVFFGDSSFGASKATVTFDANIVQVVGVTSIPGANLTPQIAWKVQGNTVTIISVITERDYEPKGSVGLARIEFKASGTVGQRATVSSRLVQGATALRTLIKPGTGLGGEITVTPVVVSAERVRATGLDADITFSQRQRALRLTRPGQRVELLDYSDGVLLRTRVENRVIESVGDTAQK